MDALIGMATTPAGWGAALLIAVGLFLMFRRGSSGAQKQTATPNVRATKTPGQGAGIPPAVRLVPQPLMTDAEAALYNMMRMAVQEQFLLFAQVPLWCLIDIRADDPQERVALLKEIAFRRAQFVLVHPGTLQVSKVVEIDDQGEASPQKEARDRLLDEVFARARIPIVRLNKGTEYSVAALAGLLGVEPTELDDP